MGLDCLRLLQDLPVIKLQAPLVLYHNTERNSPALLEYLRNEHGEQHPTYRAYAALPFGSYPLEVSQPKYFSLSRLHPLYYRTNKHDPNAVALEYTTFAPLFLFDGRNYRKEQSTLRLLDCLKHSEAVKHCVVGWLMRDDPHDDWYEVYLFKPLEVLFLSANEIHYSEQEVRLLDAAVTRLGYFFPTVTKKNRSLVRLLSAPTIFILRMVLVD